MSISVWLSRSSIVLTLLVALFCLGYAIVSIWQFVSGWSVEPSLEDRVCYFADLPARAERLIGAIQRYTAIHGRPPDTLPQLIPEFLDVIPTTGYSRFPHFIYVRLPSEGPRHWELEVFCPWTFGSGDRIVFRPDEDYSDIGGRRTRRIGSWLYVEDDF
jgi:hypothetical protein